MILRIGVTGSRGFIGGHLMEALSAARIGEVRELNGRLEDEENLQAFVSQANIIVHLAGVNRAEPENIVKGNVSGCFRLLQAIAQAALEKKQNARKWVLFASTTQQQTPYAWSKLACEEMLSVAAECGRIMATVVRLPNIFGPRCRPFYNSVIATFCHLVAQGKTLRDLPIHGDGSDLREFLYVGELVRHLVGKIQEGTTKSYQCLTLTGERLRVREIAEILTTPERLSAFPYLEHTLTTCRLGGEAQG